MTNQRGFFERLSHAQYIRPWAFVLGAVLSIAISLPLAMQLGLKAGLDALLPANKPSILDANAAKGRIGGLSTLTLALESQERAALPKFAEALVPKLQALQGHKIRSVDWNIAAHEDFVYANRHLYAPLDDLRQIRDELDERLIYEKTKANPLFVSLDDEAPPDPKAIVDRMSGKSEKANEMRKKYPGGFFLHPDEGLLAIFLRTDLEAGDAGAATALMAEVDRLIAELHPNNFAKDLHVEYGGDLTSFSEEHDAIAREMTIASVLTSLGILLVIYIFFRRVRAIVLLGLPLLPALAVTFGIAKLAVDHLNASTGFLTGIVIGNGVNPMIIWLARYYEARRAGSDVRSSADISMQDSWRPTLVAVLAAATAYASLIATDFRGFRDFGIIGATGILAAWLSTVLVLPALVVIAERLRPLVQPGDANDPGPYGPWFLSLVERWPRAIIASAGFIGVASVGLVAYAMSHDPIEYDFRNLQSVRESASVSKGVNRRAGSIVGKSASGSGIVLLVPRRDDTAPTVEKLETARDKHGAPYGGVRSIAQLLPTDQATKLPVLADIRSTLLKLRAYGDDAQQKQIDENIPPEKLRTLVDADLPEVIARTFTERDGTRGRLIFVEPQDGQTTWDGRYLVRWSAALRAIRLDNGERPPIVGRATIFADIIDSIWDDGPKAILYSFLATLALFVLTFRRQADRMLAMLTLLLGIMCMAGMMVVMRNRLNFLNFVAVPISLGIGVDYGVNVLRRFNTESERVSPLEAIRATVRESGGAVILCSLTTVIGYVALQVSANKALRSFGSAMAISELSCLLTAVLVMPAYLLLRARRSPPKPPAT